MRQAFPVVSMLTLLTVILFAARTWAVEAELEFRLGGQVVTTVSLVELQAKLRSHRVRFFNILMKKEKIYEAFALKDVLNFG